MKLAYAEIDSPLGRICVMVGPDGLCALDYTDRLEEVRAQLERRFGPVELEPHPDPEGVIDRLRRYLAGEIRALEDIRIDPGGTPFQQRVWAALRSIPAGRTWSYGQLATAIGAPVGASRAVGAANGSNPIAIVVPCHRVIGASGTLTGYAGGLERKRWLLCHEGVSIEETPARADDAQLSLWGPRHESAAGAGRLRS
jgi:methylated-DNA-[protein]-cysteine S-methyltransferase